ncbi:mannan endo-1 4-beta-mannosidase 6 [Phtheirospermum japonicum]|uniref:mannan endo-1,4-beta-mannosidase n=1 Tax=Phtheirospermum japonicum TaxID=374723 RepID=A0A830BSI3_9LAMI|nr:mannan endo-1 4-beta-mannosidase 6 [Phtheirospermum japonicum]
MDFRYRWLKASYLAFILSMLSLHASCFLENSARIYDVDEMDEDAWSMVQKNGNQFTVDGRPFYVNGFNTYWLMVFAVDQSTRGKVSEVFQQASAVGLSVCRTWAFNDGQWRALQISPSVYDEAVFKGLDFVISEAKKYKIRLILPLVNNWEAYGGKAQYVKWGKAAGLNLTSDDDFFSHQTIKGYYKAHVNTVLNRVNTLTNITYKDDPTIFAWELINEPRCESDPSGNKLQFTKSWVQAHIEDAEKFLGMPVVFTEFGVSTKDPGYNLTYRDTLIGTVYKALLNSTKYGGGGGGSLLWQVFPEGTDYMDDGYAIVLPKSPSTSNIISAHSTRLNTFNSLCSKECRWRCKKKHAWERSDYHDEL